MKTETHGMQHVFVPNISIHPSPSFDQYVISDDDEEDEDNVSDHIIQIPKLNNGQTIKPLTKVPIIKKILNENSEIESLGCKHAENVDNQDNIDMVVNVISVKEHEEPAKKILIRPFSQISNTHKIYDTSEITKNDYIQEHFVAQENETHLSETQPPKTQIPITQYLPKRSRKERMSMVTSEPDFQPCNILSINQMTAYQQYLEQLQESTQCRLCKYNTKEDKDSGSPPDIIITKHYKMYHEVNTQFCENCRYYYIVGLVTCKCIRCDACNIHYGSNSDLMIHFNICHINVIKNTKQNKKTRKEKKSVDIEVYPCTMSLQCKFTTASDRHYANHIAEKHCKVIHEEPLLVECPLCNFKQVKIGKLSRHVFMWHVTQKRRFRTIKDVYGLTRVPGQPDGQPDA